MVFYLPLALPLLHGGSLMTPTLNLADRLLALGTHFRDLGRPHDAHDIFSRLLGFRTLPVEVACQAQLALAEIALKRRRYKTARRHLAAVLQSESADARVNYLMAVACREDDQGNFRRAAIYYARSLELDPTDVRCRGEYGLVLLQLGRTEEGLDHLAQAHDEAPDDLDTLARRLRGLRQAGKLEEARVVLRQTRFRFRHNPAFEKLSRDFQFQIVRQEQEFARLQAQQMTDGDGPVLLPFVRHEAHESLPRPTLLGRPRIRKLRRPGGPDNEPGTNADGE
jgi:tetratricopeptide (TPR) repeat protein